MKANAQVKSLTDERDKLNGDFTYLKKDMSEAVNQEASKKITRRLFISMA